MLIEKRTHARPRAEASRPKLDEQLPEFEPGDDSTAWLRCVESDTTVELLDRWMTGFRRYHPEVRIDRFVGGSTSAGPALTGEWADLGLIARELLPREERPFVDKFGYRPERIAVAGGSYRTIGYTDAIAVFVHPDNPLDSLSLPQLAAIYGEIPPPGHEPIVTWGQLGLEGEWAGERIRPWGTKPENGFEHFLRERVLRNGRYRSGIAVRETVRPLPSAVAEDRYAIGYAGVGYLTPTVKALALAADDCGPHLSPSMDNVATHRYPLSRLIYLFLNRKPGGQIPPGLRQFVRYVLSYEGQQAVLDEGIFMPLPAEIVSRELGRLH
ncbi:PstS family phosphate ABC transporter substrate-binding protein [Actinopolymorpha alba]|uniref:PstS family phosphate ABC transporter substrate-binding protein n=1 Tax=Actinopolymorpha alba TaxID=533267 RepID=UPI0003660199|nr:substrate-binding domain-containing protein [Actinopolymorpha alba]